MKPREALRVGLVGCGEIADVHIPAILKLEHVELVAVCDLDEDLARKVARRYSVGSYYTDLSELLLKGQLDLVDITTPPRTHLALSIKAMEAGCHVLVEKPRLAGTASGALRVALRPYGIGHHNLIERFVESLRNDTELPVTAEEGREVTRLYQAIASQI